jgi:hypothetical protein
MYIVAYFIGTDGAPETGLSPTVNGHRLEETAQVLTDAALTEAGDGWYFYNFSLADSSYHYVFTVDSVTLPGLLRYAAGTSSPDSADISTLITNVDEVSDDIKNQYYAFRDMRRKHPEWNAAKDLGGGYEQR